MDTPRKEVIRLWHNDRVLAHRTLFKHRHPQESPLFHDEMIDAWHGDDLRVLFMVFRGGAKSTISEEGIVLRACFRDFRNMLLVGSTFDRALERLNAIRTEFDQNDRLNAVFGDLRGPTWTDGEIVLANGVRILAVGKDQELRGTKHNDMRPDALQADDIEGESDVKDDRGRKKMRRWWFKELYPALAPGAWMRMNATPLGPEALAVNFEKSNDWVTKKFPIKYLDEEGVWCSSWPERFPLEYIEQVERDARRQGLGSDFMAEYMVTAEAEEDKVFKHEMFRTEPRARTWEAVYGAFDPARTSKPSSAQTGFASWTYYRDQMIVWDAWGKHLKPDEIVKSIFDFHDEMQPVEIGVEVDGVNDFLTQPIQREAQKRGVFIPTVDLKAPNGKHDFIKGLHPWFNARDVIFAKDLPDLRAQFNGFPTGLIDIANALAYALKMRPGIPIYDHFGPRHVVENLTGYRHEPVYLALNAAKGAFVTGVLAQYRRGVVQVLDDYVRQGEPVEVLADIVNAASLKVGRRPELVAGPIHWDKHLNVGLRQAASRIPADVRQGLAPAMGRLPLSNLLAGATRDEEPLIAIHPDARHTLNALGGGYARAVVKGGGMSDGAKEGVYRVMMEGLESLCGLISVVGSPNSEADDRLYDYAGGRRYLTARPR